MRKKSDRARHGLVPCLVLLIALCHPESLHSQVPAESAVKPVAVQSATGSGLGFARFVGIGPEGRAGIDAPNPPISLLMEVASRNPGLDSPLAISLSLTARSTLETLPKPADGGAVLVSPSADNQLFALNEDAIKTAGRMIFGLFSHSGGSITVDLYLVSAAEERAEKLGTYEGSIGDLDGSRKAFSGILLPRFSNHARRIIDFNLSPQGAAIVIPDGGTGESPAALLVGQRLFLYTDEAIEVEIGRRGFITKRVIVQQTLDDVYNIVQVQLSPDPVSSSSASLDLVAASAQIEWKSEKDFFGGSARFSSSLGRFVLSLPVTAIALGVFFLGYEGYSRSAITEKGLLLRGGAAVLSLGFSIGFAVETGIDLARLVSVAK